ncbi:hypothetical protein PFISCL1PPCAC_24319 [Pristionchus fissidentatus]|uniref:PX domain-containing protein n=1 Tax=Pristionchus fissidentatus TaxID=1538716 RepID=A0AAV5WM15_9BILA|nr:hypothetical protein PFISCL1PPCAC_24319 [Pristionchus fissidentatus]
MIHVVIPSTTTLVERSDGVTKYTAFNIHINGWLHASIRFSLLHKFAETVRLKFDSRFGGRFSLPEFPPKKMSLSRLDGSALEERRVKIAKYLQTLVQQAEIVRSAVVERTFLEFQLESYRPASSSVNLDVFLGDGSRHFVRCGVLLNTRDVMKVLSETLECDFDLLCQYFGMFMVRERREDGRGSNDDLLPVRLLRNFESPYVSLQMANQRSASRGVQYKLQLRRMVWEVRAHERLIECPRIKELLFKQAASEYSSGLFSACNGETADQLNSLKEQPHAVDRFLRLCTQQSTYGYEDLGVAECELPQRPANRIEASMRVGRRQLLLSCPKSGQEWIFRATRIRIWRISQPSSVVDPLLFQFEYLVGKDHFEWITIHTDQAILLSLLLQSIGADILNEQYEASKEAARELVSESDIKMPSPSPSTSTAHLSYPRDEYRNYTPYAPSNGATNGGAPIPEIIAGTANSSFANEITDDDL